MHTLTIHTDRGSIELNFSKFDQFLKPVSYQMGVFLEGTMEEFLSKIERKLNESWSRKEFLFKTEKQCNILDIGSGVGLLSIVASKYLNNNSKFYLVDKSLHNKQHNHWGNDHGFYNDWNVFHDIAQNSGVAVENFTLLDTIDPWPEHLDLIMSNFSYMWHYDKDTYWDRISPYTKKSCTLSFDIINRHDRNIVEEITKELESLPTVREYPFPTEHWYMNELINENQSYGKFCVWR